MKIFIELLKVNWHLNLEYSSFLNMKAQRLQLTFPYKLAQEFKRAIPRGERSQFIAQIVREELPNWKKIIQEEK